MFCVDAMGCVVGAAFSATVSVAFVPSAERCVSKRSRCDAMRMCLELGEPSALRRSCVLKRSRCRAVRMCVELGEPS